MMDNQSLVACTGRLERITVTLEKMGGGAGGKGKTDLESLINRLEKVMPNLRSGSEEKDAAATSNGAGPSPGYGGGGVSSGGSGGLPYLAAFGDVLGAVDRYVKLSKTIGGDVATHAQMVERAFELQKKFLEVASRCKEPTSPAVLQKLLAGTSEVIGEIQNYREKHRSSPHFNHLSAWSEGIPALGWVTVAPTPGPHVKEMLDSAQFYTNRVLKDWKEKDKTHADWVKAVVEIFAQLQSYIKQHHTTGLVWNARSGGEPTAADFAACAGGAGGGAPAPPAGGGPPPPPPMIDLSADIAKRQAAMSQAGGNDRGGLFSEINRGTDVTKGLKKVTADMQTHKNPNLRGASAVPAKAAPQPAAAGGGPTSRIGADPSKPPSMELVNGKKWMVEHQNGVEGLVVTVTAINQAVYIFRCTNTVVQIKGKLSSVVMDSCKKTAVVFDSLVGPAEFVNCQGCKMQVIGTVPIVSIDNCDGVQMFVSEEAKKSLEIVTSKSSEMNVMVPQADGDFVEYAIPEQYRTTITPSGLNTVVAESTG